jgi:hypothetical protein
MVGMVRWMLAVGLSVGLSVGLWGCAGARLPYEARLWLMDAEEQLLTAGARVVEARAALVAAQADVARAERTLERLEVDGEAGGELGGEVRPEAAALPALRAEALAEVRYAEANLTLRVQELEATEASQGCAVMSLEAARAEAEVRAKLEGAQPAEPKALAERAAGCLGALEKHRGRVTEVFAKRASARAAVERARSKAATLAPTMRPRAFLE